MARYAVIEDNKIIELYDLLPTSWRNISNFNALSKEERAPLGWVDLVRDCVDINPDHTKYYLTEPEYVYENGQWIERVVLKEWDADTQLAIKEQDRAIATNQFREYRNQILKATDWTQGLDAPISADEKLAWAKYRQDLRDATEIFASKYPITPKEVLPLTPFPPDGELAVILNG